MEWAAGGGRMEWSAGDLDVMGGGRWEGLSWCGEAYQGGRKQLISFVFLIC